MEEEKKKEHVNNLLEDGWFFGNSLLSRSKSSKIMVRCNSDPCPSSSTKEATLVSQDASKASNPLFRTPSLPPCFGRDQKFEQEHDQEHEKKVEEEEEEEDEEPRMGDLIRQAMPIKPLPMPGRRLDRAPSLPPCRGKDGLHNTVQNIQNGPGEAGRLTRRGSIDSWSEFLPEKAGPVGMTKLSRRASIDSSMVLPPKYTSKGTKQGGSNSKNRPQRKLDLPVINEPSNTESRTHLDKSKSLKSLTDLETEELQGFKDLGFSFETKKVTPNVAQILPALQRKGSIDSNFKTSKVHSRPYLSESWERKPASSPLSAPPVMKRAGDQKSTSPSADDMKAQIKFWARAVASNVRQEC